VQIKRHICSLRLKRLNLKHWNCDRKGRAVLAGTIFRFKSFPRSVVLATKQPDLLLMAATIMYHHASNRTS